MVKCSILVPDAPQAPLAGEWLHALAETANGLGYEVLVVTGDPGRLEPPAAAVRIVPVAEGRSLAAACFEAARSAAGRFICFLSADIVPPSHDCLEALAAYADERPAVAVVGGKLLGPGGRVLHAGLAIGQDGLPRPLYAGFPAGHPAVNRPRRLQAVAAVGALARRQALEELNLSGPVFTNACADTHLCLLLGRAGHEIHYCPAGVFRSSRRGALSLAPDDSDGAAWFLKSWAGKVAPDDLRYYQEDGLLEVKYGDGYPLHLALSPLLAYVTAREEDPAGAHVLQARSDKVLDLLEENLRLTLRLQERELRMSERLAQLTDEVQKLARDREKARSAGKGPRPADANGPVTPALSESQGTGYRYQKLTRRIAYQKLTERVRSAVQDTLPAGARVLVVSRGDEELLEFEGRTGFHFPQTEDGVYAGCYPNDSRDAITQLELVRARCGADHLLFPDTAFWWHAFYKEFTDYLDREHQRVHGDNSCIIYRLAARAPAEPGAGGNVREPAGEPVA